MEHLREVSPLSRRGDVVRGRTHPLSDPLQSGIRFHPHPFSVVPLASFAGSLPSRGDSGVTSFTFSIDPGLRSCLSAGGATSATGDDEAPVPDHVPFWFKPDSIFGLFPVTTFISTLPGLTLPRTAGPRPPWCWQSSCRLARSRPIRRSRLRCSPGFGPRRCQRRPLG